MTLQQWAKSHQLDTAKVVSAVKKLIAEGKLDEETAQTPSAEVDDRADRALQLYFQIQPRRWGRWRSSVSCVPRNSGDHRGEQQVRRRPEPQARQAVSLAKSPTSSVARIRRGPAKGSSSGWCR